MVVVERTVFEINKFVAIFSNIGPEDVDDDPLGHHVPTAHPKIGDMYGGVIHKAPENAFSGNVEHAWGVGCVRGGLYSWWAVGTCPVVHILQIIQLQSWLGGQWGVGWQLVRSVPNETGGTIDFVLIPEAKQRDREHYKKAAEAVCGLRTTCMVNFWTDPTHIPTRKTGWISVKDLAVMSASYERHPTYKEPVLALACWLYPNRTVGESEKCAYEPGAKRPPDK